MHLSSFVFSCSHLATVCSKHFHGYRNENPIENGYGTDILTVNKARTRSSPDF